MKLLVTGATGPIGRALLAQLSADDDVFVLARDPSRAPPTPARASAIASDLRAPLDLAALPPALDAVVHLAQEDDFRRFPDAAPQLFAVNVAAPVALVEHARRAGARRFVHASSGGLHRPSATPLAEDAPLVDPTRAVSEGPLGGYLATKRATELLLAAYAPHLDVTALRVFFAYGPGQKPTFLLPSLVRSVRTGNPLKLAGPDGLRLNPVHADDVARVILAALGAPTRPPQVLQVAGPDVWTLRGIGELIGRLVGVEPRFEVTPAGDAPRDVVADLGLLRATYGGPTVGLADGLARWLADDPPELRVG